MSVAGSTSEKLEASVTIERTTISGNTAEGTAEASMFDYFEGAVHIIDSTISGNSSGGDGGGLYITEWATTAS